MRLECPHCGYIWDYGGSNRFYATCPQCRYKVRVITTPNVTPRPKTDVEPIIQPKLRGVAKIVEKTLTLHNFEKESLIQVLLSIQRSQGWLPQEMLYEVSKQLDLPPNQVYQIATFYKAFSLAPRGKHLIKVCNGTSCNVRGAQTVAEGVQRKLGIEKDETTADGRFSFESVNCLGCCAMGPMMTVDGEYFGKMSLSNLDSILEKFR
jgi:NADH-quinone oxidoreductase subunit E